MRMQGIQAYGASITFQGGRPFSMAKVTKKAEQTVDPTKQESIRKAMAAAQAAYAQAALQKAQMQAGAAR